MLKLTIITYQVPMDRHMIGPRDEYTTITVLKMHSINLSPRDLLLSNPID